MERVERNGERMKFESCWLGHVPNLNGPDEGLVCGPVANGQCFLPLGRPRLRPSQVGWRQLSPSVPVVASRSTFVYKNFEFILSKNLNFRLRFSDFDFFSIFQMTSNMDMYSYGDTLYTKILVLNKIYIFLFEIFYLRLCGCPNIQ